MQGETHAVLETVLATAMIERIWLVGRMLVTMRKILLGGGYPSKAIGIVTSLLIGNANHGECHHHHDINDKRAVPAL